MNKTISSLAIGLCTFGGIMLSLTLQNNGFDPDPFIILADGFCVGFLLRGWNE